MVHFFASQCILCITCYWTAAVLRSLNFRKQSTSSWSATVGVENGTVHLYESDWQEKRHYVCQYDGKYSKRLLKQIN